MARPRKDIDPEKVRQLAAIHCTVDEIAAVMDCSKDTLERRFAALIEKGREEGRASLRRVQYKAALAGNATMMIWLGKQLLGQKDRQEVTGADGAPLVPVANQLAAALGIRPEELPKP
jgi:hypothetical protein